MTASRRSLAVQELDPGIQNTSQQYLISGGACALFELPQFGQRLFRVVHSEQVSGVGHGQPDFNGFRRRQPGCTLQGFRTEAQCRLQSSQVVAGPGQRGGDQGSPRTLAQLMGFFQYPKTTRDIAR